MNRAAAKILQDIEAELRDGYPDLVDEPPSESYPASVLEKARFLAALVPDAPKPEGFEAFQATRTFWDVADHFVGFTYLGNKPDPDKEFTCGIEIADTYAKDKGAAFHLTIANCQYASNNLEELELELFDYAKAEGLIGNGQ